MNITEENLVRELNRRNEDALRFLIDQYGGRILGLIHRLMDSYPNDQEDCLNDVFLTIWDNISSFDEGKSSFSTWLMAVARYRILKYCRDHRKYQQPYIDISDLDLEDPERSDSLLLNEIQYEEFQLLLRSLSEKDRGIFTERFWYESSYEEIQLKTGLSQSALYSRISRGMRKLRETIPHPLVSHRSGECHDE